MFGPAINEVVDLERHNKHPRILCTPQIVDIASMHPDMALVTTDPTKEKVLNLFSSPPMDPLPLLEEILQVPEIRRQINTNLKDPSLSKEILEKWQYTKSLVEAQLKQSIYDKLQHSTPA